MLTVKLNHEYGGELTLKNCSPVISVTIPENTTVSSPVDLFKLESVTISGGELNNFENLVPS